MDAAQYTAKLMGYTIGGCISTAMSIGYEMGLVGALEKETTALTAAELASKCKLKNRSVLFVYCVTLLIILVMFFSVSILSFNTFLPSTWLNLLHKLLPQIENVLEWMI